MNIDDMTPRQRTYALKKFDAGIYCIYTANEAHDCWYVEYKNGDTDQVHNMHCCKAFDGVAACEREAREIATYKKLKELS